MGILACTNRQVFHSRYSEGGANKALTVDFEICRLFSVIYDDSK